MKIEIEFKRSVKGVEANIQVIDKEDYPTEFILDNLWPDNLNIGNNSKGPTAWTSNDFSSGKEAEEWARDKVISIKRALDEWRKEYLPLPYKMTI
jgi:hypothetical protein